MALFWKHHRHVWGEANVNRCSRDLWCAFFCGLALWIAFTSVQFCLLSCAQSLSGAIDSSSEQIHNTHCQLWKTCNGTFCVLLLRGCSSYLTDAPCGEMWMLICNEKNITLWEQILNFEFLNADWDYDNLRLYTKNDIFCWLLSQ